MNEDLTAMTLGGGDSSFDCVLDGRDIDCSIAPITMDMNAYGLDAVGTFTTVITGEWDSDTSFTLEEDLTITCTGADCAAAGMEDCTLQAELTATLVE